MSGNIMLSYARDVCERTVPMTKGVEYILKFSVENWWAGDRESLLTGKPSVNNIEALEDTVLVMFSREQRESPSIQSIRARLPLK